MPHVQENDRVEMTGVMRDDPAPLAVGERGTVEKVWSADQIFVRWDSGRTLILLAQDPFRVLGRGE